MSFSKWMKGSRPTPLEERYGGVESASLSGVYKVVQHLQEGDTARAALSLPSAFSWGTTPQGTDYWMYTALGVKPWSKESIDFVTGLYEYLEEKKE